MFVVALVMNLVLPHGDDEKPAPAATAAPTPGPAAGPAAEAGASDAPAGSEANTAAKAESAEGAPRTTGTDAAFGELASYVAKNSAGDSAKPEDPSAAGR